MGPIATSQPGDRGDVEMDAKEAMRENPAVEEGVNLVPDERGRQPEPGPVASRRHTALLRFEEGRGIEDLADRVAGSEQRVSANGWDGARRTCGSISSPPAESVAPSMGWR